MKKPNLLLAFLCLVLFSNAQTISDFENLTLDTNLKYWNGSDFSGGFTSGNAFFRNDYDSSFGGYWGGFAASRLVDTTRKGWPNEYGVISGKGYQNSNTWAVCYVADASWVRLQGNAKGKTVAGFWINNGTYPFNSMKNGDLFSKKFGGKNGTDTDWFKLTVTSYPSEKTVDFYLADYRFTDSTKDYIVKDWTWVDLTSLGNTDSLKFLLFSTDVDSQFFVINTPAYFHVDNFTTWEYYSGLEEINALHFYPNPAQDAVRISHGKPGDRIEIYQLSSGKLMSIQNWQSPEISLQNLPNGMYVVRIVGEKSYQGRIVVQHP